MKNPIRLKVIPEPELNTRAVINYQGDGTIALRGSDPSARDICCGGCGAPLAKGLLRNQLANIVIRCKNCGAFNDATDVALN